MLNAWMQKPVGVAFADGRALPTSLEVLAANPLVLPKILHTVGAAWVLGGMVVASTCAFFLLRGRHLAMARGGLKVASLFTLAALLVTGAAGHWSGERLVQHQPMKFAAIEALWSSEGGSPDLLLFALPDRAAQANRAAIGLPGVLGAIAGAGDEPLLGIRELQAQTADMIRRELRSGRPLPRLGHAALLGPAARADASDAEIDAAARRAVPNVPIVFWAFRVMLGAFVLLAGLMLLMAWKSPDPASARGRWLLVACVAALPLPWIAIEAGWIVCEVGRQPWTVTGLLPTLRSIGVVPAAVAHGQLANAAAAGLLILAVHLALHWRHLRRGPQPLGPAPWARWVPRGPGRALAGGADR